MSMIVRKRPHSIEECYVKDLKPKKKFRSFEDNRLKNITNMSQKRLQASDEPDPIKKRKISIETLSQTSNLSSNNEPCNDSDIKFIKSLKNVLGNHYFDVSSRLGLDYVPECVRDIDACIANHSGKNPVKPRKINDTFQLDVKQLIKEDRPLHYLKMIEDTIVRGEFPDNNMLLLLLELMLTVSKATTEYTERDVVNECFRVMDATTTIFPPCWHGLKNAYMSIMTSRLQSDSFQKLINSEGIFKMVLSLLEKYTETGDDAIVPKQKPSSYLSVMPYKQWEAHQSEQKYDFNLLKREDKLQRLFLVLHLMVKILEMDLSVWILKYPKQTKYFMELETKKPMIASLIWDDNTSGDTNAFIKRIIGIYVNVISLGFPSRDVDALSKLISLIGAAINLSEFQEEIEKGATGQIEIIYPCVKHNTIYYASNIKRAIEQSSYYGIDLYTRVIDSMRNPMIRLLLANELFDKIGPYSMEPITMTKCAKLLRKYKNFTSENEAKGVLRSATSLSTIFEKYLVMDKKKKRAKFSEISAEQYIDLLLKTIQSYLEVFRIHDFHISLGNHEEIDETILVNPPNEEIMGSQNFCQKIDFDALEANIEMTLSIVDLKEEISQKGPKRQQFRYVSVEPERCEFIHDEIKFYRIILNDATILHSKHPEMFEELKTFVDNLKN